MIKLIKIFNIEIKVNYSLIPILILGIFFGFIKEIIVVLAIVTLHELAHSIMSNKYGYEANLIELFIFGGVVTSEEIIFLKPSKVILISLAGPLLNFVLFFLGLTSKNIFSLQSEILDFSIYVNLSLGLFNLLPIIPLDGGRILRAYLSKFMDMKKATYTTVFIGKIVCMIILVIGIILTIESFRGLTLIVFSVYLYYKNNKEKEIISLQHMQRIFTKPKGINKKRNIKVKHIYADKSTSLKDILKAFSDGTYCYIKVITPKGKLIGEFSEGEILDAVIKYDSLTTLEELININKHSKLYDIKYNKRFSKH